MSCRSSAYFEPYARSCQRYLSTPEPQLTAMGANPYIKPRRPVRLFLLPLSLRHLLAYSQLTRAFTLCRSSSIVSAIQGQVSIHTHVRAHVHTRDVVGMRRGRLPEANITLEPLRDLRTRTSDVSARPQSLEGRHRRGQRDPECGST